MIIGYMSGFVRGLIYPDQEWENRYTGLLKHVSIRITAAKTYSVFVSRALIAWQNIFNSNLHRVLVMKNIRNNSKFLNSHANRFFSEWEEVERCLKVTEKLIIALQNQPRGKPQFKTNDVCEHQSTNESFPLRMSHSYQSTNDIKFMPASLSCTEKLEQLLRFPYASIGDSTSSSKMGKHSNGAFNQVQSKRMSNTCGAATDGYKKVSGDRLIKDTGHKTENTTQTSYNAKA